VRCFLASEQFPHILTGHAAHSSSLFTIHRRREGRWWHSYTHSVIGLVVLLIFFVVGAAVSTHLWGDLDWCWDGYLQCRVLTVLVGIVWSAAIVTLILLLMELHYVSRHRAWGYRKSSSLTSARCQCSDVTVFACIPSRAAMHGRYDPTNYNEFIYPHRRFKF
jgi:hypothetical protein